METETLKSIIVKIQALEKTIIESDLRDKYIENKAHWSNKLDKVLDDAMSNLPDYLKEQQA